MRDFSMKKAHLLTRPLPARNKSVVVQASKDNYMDREDEDDGYETPMLNNGTDHHRHHQHTYAVPNKVPQPVGVSNVIPQEDSVDDLSRGYIRAIITGNVEELQKIQAEAKKDSHFHTRLIEICKIKDVFENCAKDFNQIETSLTITPLDLAIEMNQVEILNNLIKFGLRHLSHFPDYIRTMNFKYPAIILENIMDKSPKLALDILDSRISLDKCDSSNNEDLFQLEQPIMFDFTPCFHPINSQRQSNVLRKMLDKELNDHFEHPFTETLIQMKWQQYRMCYIITLMHSVFLALLVSVLSLDKNSFPIAVRIVVQVMLSASLIAELLTLIVNAIVTGPLRLKLSCFKRLDLLLPRPRWIFQSVLISAILGHLLSYGVTKEHLTSWALLLAWLNTMLRLEQHPGFGVWVHILRKVIWDTIRFGVTILPAIIGFALIFQRICSDERKEIIPSPLQHISVLGRIEAMCRSSAHESYLILVSIFTIVITISAFNILIALAVTRIRDCLLQKRRYRYIQMINHISRAEKFLRYFARKHSFKWMRKTILLQNEENCCYKLLPNDDKGDHYVQLVQNCILKKNNYYGFKITDEIWRKAKVILDEQSLGTAESSAKQGDQGLYTSMYWSGQTENSEDLYEPIGSAKNNSQSKSIRDSVLKELRKEMSRLMRFGFRDQKEPKAEVNVRPGLALGVITLQAGSRGPKLLLE